MLRSLVGILTVFLLVPAFGQMKADYQLGAIMAVVARTNTSPENSVTSYDISVRVGSTLYVVLYTPPPGAGTPQYAAGRELLVKVGGKTIRFSDMLGESLEVPMNTALRLNPPASQPKQTHPSASESQSGDRRNWRQRQLQGQLDGRKGEFALCSFEGHDRHCGRFHYRPHHRNGQSERDPGNSRHYFHVRTLRIGQISKPVSLQAGHPDA